MLCDLSQQDIGAIIYSEAGKKKKFVFLSCDKERVPTYTLPGGVSTFSGLGHSARGWFLDRNNLPNDKVVKCSLWFLSKVDVVYSGCCIQRKITHSFVKETVS